MRTEISFIDYGTFQTELDNKFGSGVFTLIIGDDPANQKFYIEYENVTQTQLNEALALATENATNLLSAIKVRLYETFISYASRAITIKTKPEYTQVEIDSAYNWLQNQELPCPSCVQFVALSKLITNQQAAQEIVNSPEDYANFTNTVNSIKNTGQTETLATTDIFTCKATATIYLDQLKNLW